VAARKIGEFELISAIEALVAARPKSRGVRVGIGDDAAVLQTTSRSIVTTDALVEGVHFERHWLTPAQLGARAFRVASSDVAAMGGVARYVLLSLTIPEDMPIGDVRRCAEGLIADAEAASTSLVGGNISYGPVFSLTLTVVGAAGARVLTRSGARPGDSIVVTGTLGDAAAGVEQLLAGGRRSKLIDAYRRPPSRLAIAGRLARGSDVTAMLDLSDGLGRDLDHLCDSSGVSARVDLDAVPVSPSLRRYARAQGTGPLGYATRGEDYELLIAVGNGEAGLRRVARACKTSGVAMTVIGTLGAKISGARVRDSFERPIEGGWDHLRRRPSD
jgi:thiamine-monophosphate kinase